MALIARVAAVALLIATAPAFAEQQQSSDADYMSAIRQELARLDLEAACETTSHECVFAKRLGPEGPTVKVKIRYSATTDTVYIFIDRFIELRSAEGPSLALSRRLLELNSKMVTSKLEWDATTNSIRLSVVLNTDSNFDRRAFRSQILGLLATAEKILPQLTGSFGEASATG